MTKHTNARPGWRGLGLNIKEEQFDLLTRILSHRRWTKRAFVEDAIARQAQELFEENPALLGIDLSSERYTEGSNK